MTALNQATSPEFVISRMFDSPRERVFKAWTDTDRLVQWWGPKGFTMLAANNDLRPGGVFHYGMRSPEGHEMWGKWVYSEIAPPERLTFVASFADMNGNSISCPFMADWPLDTLSTITFEEADGKTAVTLRGVPVGASEIERSNFENAHDQMQQGWTGTLDQLSEYLGQS